MVSELHKRGYQAVRIAPGMSASGMHWRCNVTPASNTLASNGALLANWGGSVASYSSAEETRYFGWEDATTASARELADMFIDRFPEICTQGHGRDWEYAGWFVEMLGLAEAGYFPIAYADWALPTRGLGLTQLVGAPPPAQELPLPPPGMAEGLRH